MTSPWQPPHPTPAAEPAAGLPQYGEMAPPGYVSPVAPPPAPAAPEYGVPTYHNGSPVAPIYYAAPPVVRKNRTADIVVTCILLTVGLFSMLTSLTVPPQLPTIISDVGKQYGVSNFDTSGLAAYGLGITISQIVLYLVALGVSIPLMIKRRVAFWVPLTAGAVAAIIFWVLLTVALFSDPRIWDAVQAHANR